MSIVRINEGEGDGEGDGSGFNSSLNFWDPNGMGMAMWNPFMDFALPPSISNFFPDLGLGSSVNTRLDWRETARAHVWKVVLPGFTNEDVLVQLLDDRVLQVSVESGNFMSRFKIPEDGNIQELTVNMHHGLLLVTVPKFQQPAPNRNIRVIEIHGSD